MATVALSAPTVATPAEPDRLYEVVDGHFVEKPPMGAFEYHLAFLVGKWISVFAEREGLGQALVEMLFDLRPAVDRQRRPDVAFLSVARCPLDLRAPRSASWAIVPDLAVEIVSPNDLAIECLGKMEEYFLAGVREVWLILPDLRKVYAFTSPTAVRIHASGGALEGGEVLPGFRLPVDELFGPGPGPG